MSITVMSSSVSGQDLMMQQVPPATTPAQEVPVIEAVDTKADYKVKSVFLYHFSRFVTWPAEMAPQSHFKIGVLGDSQILAPLKKVVGKIKSVKDRRTGALLPLKVLHFKTFDDYETCQILFVSRSLLKKQRDEVIKKLDGKPVLLIGESEQFTQDGGTAGFVLVDGGVKFDLSLADAKSKGLKFDIKLLTIANAVVKSAKPKTINKNQHAGN